jgi:chromosome partitioning protein
MFQKALDKIMPKKKEDGVQAIPTVAAPGTTTMTKTQVRKAQVWATVARKGGVLKTSLTVNLAGVIAASGYKVLIIDLDSQGNTMVSFGKNPDKMEYSIYDIMTTPNAPVAPAIVNVYENIDILASNEKMEEFEFEIIPDKVKYPFPFTLLQDAVRGLRLDYDYILIDTPPNSTLIQSNALMFADRVLVPFEPETYSMRSLVKTIDRIEKFRLRHNPKLQLMGLVATKVEMTTSLHCEIMEETRKFCRKKKIPLMHTIIPKSIRGGSDISYKKLPSTLAKPNHKLAESYFELFEEVTDYEQE